MKERRNYFLLSILAFVCVVAAGGRLPAQAAGQSAGAGNKAAGTSKAATAGSTGSKTAAASEGSAQKQSGWLEKSGKMYYRDSKGKKVTGWQTIKGHEYYFGKSGKNKYQMLTGWQTIGGKKYYFKKTGKTAGQMLTGWQTIGKNKYYFIASGKNAGQMAVGWKTLKKKKYYFIPSGKNAGQMATGWQIQGKNCYYFSKKGVLDAGKTVNGSRSGDSTGSAAAKTYRRAQAIVAQITTAQMSKEQKLWTCFQYVMKTYTGRRPRTPHYYGMDWPVVYANDMFLDGSGNCFSYAAAFAYLAKACGYTNVYVCNDTGHGWTEINGLIYDPEEYRNTQHKYYGTSYDSVPGYRRGISEGQGFMHVKV